MLMRNNKILRILLVFLISVLLDFGILVRDPLDYPTISPLAYDEISLNNSESASPSSKEPGTPAGPSTVLPPPDPDSFRSVFGYIGPYYREEINKGDIVILFQTLYQWPLADWKISGLIRNETGTHVKIIAMTIQLFDSNGNILGNVAAWLPLNQLRPGEPAPFIITTSIPRSSVYKMDWHIDFVSSNPLNRLFQIVPYWQLSFGNRKRHTGYPFIDPSEPPYPYIAFGSIRNASNKTIDEARLLGAWLDEKGRVIYIDWLSFIPISVGALKRLQNTITLLPNEGVDYIYRCMDPELGPKLSIATLILWGVSQ